LQRRLIGNYRSATCVAGAWSERMTKILLAVLLLAAASVVSAAEPARAQPVQPLDQRVPNERPPNDKLDNGVGERLDPSGPAQPQGLAPSAPQPDADPAECRGLPRDARQACMEGARRAQPPASLPGATDAPSSTDGAGARETRPARPGMGDR